MICETVNLNKLSISFILGSLAILAGCSDTSDPPAIDAGPGPDAGPELPSRVRVAHFSPDAPPVDFCFVPVNGPIIGPVLGAAGLAGGVSFGNITRYLPVSAEVYTVRIIGAGSKCDAPVFEYPNVAVPAGGFSITAAALGYLDATRGPALELVFWIDDTNPAQADKVRLQTLHAAPGTPNLDIGILRLGSTQLTNPDILSKNILFKVQSTPPYLVLNPSTEFWGASSSAVGESGPWRQS